MCDQVFRDTSREFEFCNVETFSARLKLSHLFELPIVMIPQIAGAVRFSVRTEIFSISFHEPFRAIFWSTLFTLEILTYSAGAIDEYWLVFGVLPAVTGVLAAVGVGILVWRYKFSIGPQGIDCYDFWCRPMGTRWEDMISASKFSLPGLAYARIIVRGQSRAIWLPLFVDDFREMHELVELHAGTDHPLAVLLDKSDKQENT